ncbi:MAG: 30S ribosomal protein S16, partial [Bacteroidetes bacterium]|nr:30S ribosomal protein S16 [Bacteroidota bacterium]
GAINTNIEKAAKAEKDRLVAEAKIKEARAAAIAKKNQPAEVAPEAAPEAEATEEPAEE